MVPSPLKGPYNSAQKNGSFVEVHVRFDYKDFISINCVLVDELFEFVILLLNTSDFVQCFQGFTFILFD